MNSKRFERIEEIENLRNLMGTLPEKGEDRNHVEMVQGVEGIKVKLIDWPSNPYKAIYTLGTTCWGFDADKWSKTHTAHRYLVVKAVLDRNALPLALEAPKFTFVIEGVSRSSFDQIARARIGVVFSARGCRDNNWKRLKIRVPDSIWDNDVFRERFRVHMEHMNQLYSDIVDTGKSSWQDARAVMPMSIVYGFSMSISFASLMMMCGKRMKFCEQADTVAFAWLLREAIREKFPLLAAYLRPGCDWSGKCGYHKSYHMSEMFGCLFKSCGRHKVEEDDGYADFDFSCANRGKMMEQLNIHIPRPNEKIWKVPETLDEYSKSHYHNDFNLFLEE